MSRSWPSRIRIVAILTLLASLALVAARAVAFSQQPSDNPNSQLKECVRLANESMTLRGQGKLAEAITAARAMIAIERKVLAAGDPNLAVSLGWLRVSSILENNDFAAATAAQQDALRIVQKRFGEAHWETTDARLVQAQTMWKYARPRLTVAQRERLALARRLNQSSLALYNQGKYAESAESARRELAINKELLGERHPAYALSLRNLAHLLRSQGDYAAARPLCEQALAIQKDVLGERHPAYADSLSGLASCIASRC